MDEDTPDSEALVSLDNAEIVVPRDAIKIEQSTPVPITTTIDPVEFFEFLDNYDEWPTNGLRLAEAARQRGYSGKLMHFFEGMPGSFATEADVIPYAEDPSRPPFGAALDASSPGQSSVEDPTELTIGDITQGLQARREA
jgi:hypothetical protein